MVSESSNYERVTILVASYGRQKFVQRLYGLYKLQTYPNLELHIHDMSPQKSSELEALSQSDKTFKYVHSIERMQPGPTRSRMLPHSSGTIIAHWDDDDYYGPTYIEQMVSALGKGDFVSLSGWFAYSQVHQLFVYWNTETLAPIHFRIYANREQVEIVHGPELQPNQHRFPFFGFSHVYRKEVVSDYQFKEGWGHDWEFVRFLINGGAAVKTIADEKGICLHLMHGNNRSRIFPQFVLPNFLLEEIFGPEVIPYKTLTPELD